MEIQQDNTEKLSRSALKYATKYLEYKNNPIKFMEECCYLPLAGGDTLPKLYEPQKEIIRAFFKYHHLILLKSRQTGFSTLCQLIIAYISTFNSNLVSGVLSRSGAESSDFCKKVEDIVDKLPNYLKPQYKHKSVQSFSTTNGCQLHSTAVSLSNPGSVFRSKSIGLLVIDEAAHIMKIDEAWTGLGSTLSYAQQVAKERGIPYGTIVLSTPNGQQGIGKWYYKLWLDSNNNLSKSSNVIGGKKDKSGEGEGRTNEEADKSSKSAVLTTDSAVLTTNVDDGGDAILSAFRPYKIHWSEIPIFKNDPKWYDQQCAILQNNKRKINQELEMKFVGSGNNLFDDDVIVVLQETTRHVRPLERRWIRGKIGVNIENDSEGFESGWTQQGGEFIRYTHTDKDSKVLIGVDTGSGLGDGDWSTIEVFRFVDMKQIAEFKGKMAVFDFTTVVKYIAKLYPRSILIIENNSYGNQVIEEILRDESYEYNMYGEWRGQTGHKKFYPGLSTNVKTRPLILDSLYQYIIEDPSIVKSERLALELSGLVDKGNKIQADVGLHDDLAMALGFICYVRHYRKDVLDSFDNFDSTYNEMNSPTEDATDLIRGLNGFGAPLLDEYMNNEFNTFKKKVDSYIRANMGNMKGGMNNTFDLFRDGDENDIYNLLTK